MGWLLTLPSALIESLYAPLAAKHSTYQNISEYEADVGVVRDKYSSGGVKCGWTEGLADRSS